MHQALNIVNKAALLILAFVVTVFVVVLDVLPWAELDNAPLLNIVLTPGPDSYAWVIDTDIFWAISALEK